MPVGNGPPATLAEMAEGFKTQLGASGRNLQEVVMDACCILGLTRSPDESLFELATRAWGDMYGVRG